MKARFALVLGGGGFIGNHMVNRLKEEGFWVKAVDIRKPKYNKTRADSFVVGDLRNQVFAKKVFDKSYDEVYQMAADMGGAGYVFTGMHDADVMRNSAQINLNALEFAVASKVKKIFFPSSACIYPERNQMDPNNPNCKEDSAYPADPDSEYGWEKIFGERLFLAYNRNYGLKVRIARFHNIFGPLGSWNNGREKSPAAICRKVAEAKNGGTVEVWGDGKQTRTYLYIDECLEGVRKFMDSDFTGPVNIGSVELVSINELVEMVATIAGKKVRIKHIKGPLGVRGRSSDNTLIQKKIGWKPKSRLYDGLIPTYEWIHKLVLEKRKDV
jgi:GDP-D-mannose 3', 5'-epimerase